MRPFLPHFAQHKRLYNLWPHHHAGRRSAAFAHCGKFLLLLRRQEVWRISPVQCVVTPLGDTSLPLWWSLHATSLMGRRRSQAEPWLLSSRTLTGGVHRYHRDISTSCPRLGVWRHPRVSPVRHSRILLMLRRLPW